MPMQMDHETLLVEVLAHIYRRIPWAKIRTGKNAWDIWNHRVRAASTRCNLNEFVSRLSNYFGLQHLPPEVLPLLEALQPVEQEALNRLYREHIPFAMKAVVRAKEMKGDQNGTQAEGNSERGYADLSLWR